MAVDDHVHFKSAKPASLPTPELAALELELVEILNSSIVVFCMREMQWKATRSLDKKAPIVTYQLVDVA